MNAAVPRLVAIVALLGQLQWLPGALWCEREHRQPASHCDELPASGAVLAPWAAPTDAPCASSGPCLARGTAVAFEAPGALAMPAESRDVARLVTQPPDSFDPAPTPPPPQA